MAFEIISRADARAQGLKRYFTGMPCKHGHVTERLTSNLTCVECGRKKLKLYKQSLGPDAERDRLRRYAEANRDKVNSRSRARGRTEEGKSYKATWYQANKDQVREKRRANPNSSKSNIASAKRWAQANPEKAKEYSRMNRRTRRARAKQAGGQHTVADLSAIFDAQRGLCAYCKIDLSHVEKNVDHILPLALGGSNGPENLQYLCRPCNQSKGARHPDDFARSIGLLL